jgi:hypothetical protein
MYRSIQFLCLGWIFRGGRCSRGQDWRPVPENERDVGTNIMICLLNPIQAIPAFEEAVQTMKVGGIRRCGAGAYVNNQGLLFTLKIEWWIFEGWKFQGRDRS